MNNLYPTVDKEQIDNFYKQIGQNVKSKREEKKMSQLDLSILIGHKSPSFISNCENYKNSEHFNLEHLFLISHVLEINTSQLLPN